MLIQRRSTLSGKTRTMEIPVTLEQLRAWENGMLIQAAMPGLTIQQREFILTGTTQEEWDEAFKDSDEN